MGCARHSRVLALNLIWVLMTLAFGMLPEHDVQDTKPSLGGIGVGARVTRGPTWRSEYGGQDGGEGKLGTVIELRQWQSGRNVTEDTIAVRVRWDAGSVNAYRWSVGGQLRDVTVVGYRPVRPGEEAPPAHEGVAAYYAKQSSGPALQSALLQLRDDTGGSSSWVRLKGWTTCSPPCTAAVAVGADGTASATSAPAAPLPRIADPCALPWEGVSCVDGRVVGLDLARVGLTGTLPAQALCGPLIGPSLLSLSLAHNELSDPIPDVLCACHALRFLDLSSNQLTGALPSCLGQLKGLETLSLAGNRLEGSIPGEWTGLAGRPRQGADEQESIDGVDDETQPPSPGARGQPAGVHMLQPRALADLQGGQDTKHSKGGSGLKLLYLHNNPDLTGPLPRALQSSSQLRVTCTGTGLDCEGQGQDKADQHQQQHKKLYERPSG